MSTPPNLYFDRITRAATAIADENIANERRVIRELELLSELLNRATNRGPGESLSLFPAIQSQSEALDRAIGEYYRGLCVFESIVKIRNG